ncbi:MAG: alpha/beta fold hydrolase [Anaerolineae bacterium]
MSVVRFVVNLVLALVLIVVASGVLALGYGSAVASSWEIAGLDVGQPEGEWLWLDGEPFYYRFWGTEEGEPVVLVHGLQVEGSETWEPTARGLSRVGFRVLTVDLRGFGRSTRSGDQAAFSLEAQADLLARMIHQLGLADAMLVGHGWGGTVALRVSEDQPQLVGRVALLYPEGMEDQRLVPGRTLQWPVVGPALVWGAYAGGPLWAHQQRQGFLDPTLMPSDYVRDMRSLARVIGTLEAWQRIGGLSTEVLYDPVEHPDVPILAIRSTATDKTLKPLWLADLPEERLVSVEAGRWLHIERADTVSALLASFFREP